jgi:D-alanine-D-alanine ligase
MPDDVAMDGADGEIPQTAGPLSITVLMGGPSAEREISLLSGAAVADGLEKAGHRVRRADISPGDVSALDADDIDVVFIALHGEFGESGQVQELCEQRNLRYIGSGPRASELAMDKLAAKQVFRREGLTTPDWLLVEEFDPAGPSAEALERFGLPVVLKPIDGGSSVDITIARDDATRHRALEALLDRYSRAMVERFLPGREITVGILGDTPLPALEVVPAREFYDYTAKYTDSGTRYVFDHGLDDATVRSLRDAALRAHQALGCRDLSRVDFVLDGEHTASVLEVNTIPGFTSHSLLPMAAGRIGVGFDRLVDALVAMAMQR